MSELGFYLYGIIRNDHRFDPGRQIAGIAKEEEVFTVPCNEIMAIVSRVDLAEFGEKALKQNLESLTWVREKVLSHERVIEKVMSQTTIIPLKFCTIFKSRENIIALLREKHSFFTTVLDKYASKYEWGLKVYSKLKSKNIAATAAGGRDYLLGLKAEAEDKTENERRTNIIVKEIFLKIRELADDLRINRLTPKELLPANREEQVFNASFLIPDTNTKKITNLVNDLAGQYRPEGVFLELAGPLPVYSFLEGDSNENNK